MEFSQLELEVIESALAQAAQAAAIRAEKCGNKQGENMARAEQRAYMAVLDRMHAQGYEYQG